MKTQLLDIGLLFSNSAREPHFPLVDYERGLKDHLMGALFTNLGQGSGKGLLLGLSLMERHKRRLRKKVD